MPDGIDTLGVTIEEMETQMQSTNNNKQVARELRPAMQTNIPARAFALAGRAFLPR